MPYMVDFHLSCDVRLHLFPVDTLHLGVYNCRTGLPDGRTAVFHPCRCERVVLAIHHVRIARESFIVHYRVSNSLALRAFCSGEQGTRAEILSFIVPSSFFSWETSTLNSRCSNCL